MHLAYLYLFLQSSLIESPIYALAHRRRVGFGKSLACTTLINLMTHPLVFFGFMAMHRSYIASILAAELFAIVSETALHKFTIRGLSWERAFCGSLFANLVSWQLGPWITYHLFLK